MSPCMRKIVICNIVSVDGYYEGTDHNVMARPFDEGFDIYNAERLHAADTLLLGRKTYEGLKDYWPPIADNPMRQRSNGRSLARNVKSR